MEKRSSIDDLAAILRRLRGEDGCPWDRVQTHTSLRGAMLEEAYEAVDAIERDDRENLKEELGDVLLQVVFHSVLAEEAGSFTLADVIEGVCNKMIYRHPHVFGDAKADTAEEVLTNWEDLKKKEKKISTQTQAMKEIPMALPALLRAGKVQKKARDVGFDFADFAGAMEKVREEMDEVVEAVEQGVGAEEEELGDFLFAVVNISRFLKINPEIALTKASKKFINRFEYVENSALSEGKRLSEMTLKEMDFLWNEAKVKSLSDERSK